MYEYISYVNTNISFHFIRKSQYISNSYFEQILWQQFIMFSYMKKFQIYSCFFWHFQIMIEMVYRSLLKLDVIMSFQHKFLSSMYVVINYRSKIIFDNIRHWSSDWSYVVDTESENKPETCHNSVQLFSRNCLQQSCSTLSTIIGISLNR